MSQSDLRHPPALPVWWAILDRESLAVLRRVRARTAHQAWQQSLLPHAFSACLVHQLRGGQQ